MDARIQRLPCRSRCAITVRRPTVLSQIAVFAADVIFSSPTQVYPPGTKSQIKIRHQFGGLGPHPLGGYAGRAYKERVLWVNWTFYSNCNEFTNKKPPGIFAGENLN